jgi:hypothetical protein
VGPHQQGLGVRVTDTADAAVAVELAQVLLELGAEGGVLDVMNLTLDDGTHHFMVPVPSKGVVSLKW